MNKLVRRWSMPLLALSISGCGPHGGTKECSRFLSQAHEVFLRYDANGDGRISRSEWQPLIESMKARAVELKEKYGAETDPAQFEQTFLQRDKDGDGYLDFGEFTMGACGT